MAWLMVAGGSALGAVLRYWLIFAVDRHLVDHWPLGTLLVNVSGAFALALVAGLAWPAVSHWQLALIAVIGSYTTVSGFALDTLQLWRSARPLAALLNIALSLLLSLLVLSVTLAVCGVSV